MTKITAMDLGQFLLTTLFTVALLVGFRREGTMTDKFERAKVDRQAREMTFSKWAGQWFGKSASDTNHLTHLEEFFGPVSLSSIDDESVKRYREKRAGETVIRHGKPSKKAVSQTTINKEVDTLRKFLRLARWNLRGGATAS